MIEFSCLHNGGTDLPMTTSAGDRNVTFPSADMAAIHRSYQRVAVQQIEQAVLAEELGFHYFWLTEHHFQPEGAEFSPNPLQAGAAIAMKTSKIRIGQMANILQRHHPLRLAEQAGYLDVLSGGRLEFGVGRGGGTRETEPFSQAYGSSDVDRYRSDALFDEAMEIILKAWTEPSFSYHGSFLSVPPKWLTWPSRITEAYFSQPGLERSLEDVIEVRDGQAYLKELSVYPQPLQTPYPQVWQTALSTASVRSAARRGYNVCHLGAGGDQVKEVLDAYHTESEQAGWPDRNNGGEFKFGWDSARKRGVSFLRFIHVGDPTPEKRAGLYHFPNYIAESLISGVHIPAGARMTGEFFDQNGLMLHGSVQQVIDGLMADYQAGFEDYLVLPIFETPGLTGDEVKEQMHIFAEEIMPVLAKECGGTANLEPLIDIPAT
ncbi:luciferase [Arthrobacter sp. StoSoilA2]|uniref:LLM class flavin-dependent oxidoreductase n=1 Tax=Arthrobacter sp. StoSoilA2 TaxID=2830990 RepID=UPI001CC40569|nr:LLM class flavin-dependent oxidoreductase [Arthrobacter sp. StoSoilA2]BCW35822.1 luciferase [Arthrobacter sp. StoSoilA2]BCW35825.1 luciferase [Arthrobacter sp. StoSoilA2]